MSKEAVETIIGKAALDSGFRNLLFANPSEALAGYQLTGEEIAALTSMDAEGLDALSGTLDERISKCCVIPPGPRACPFQPGPIGVPWP
jgi:hypothetical protein